MGAFPVAALLIGLALAPIKLVYSFLPFFNVLDILVFATAGFIMGAAAKRRLTAAFLIVPSAFLCAYFVYRLGPTQLSQGIGVGWALSLLLVPAATLAGMHVRRSRSGAGGG